MKFKKIISVLLCTVFAVSAFSGCNEEKKEPVTLNIAIRTPYGTEEHLYNDEINQKLAELNKPYRVNFSEYSLSEYVTDEGELQFDKLAEDFDLINIQNYTFHAFKTESDKYDSFYIDDIIPYCIDNQIILSLDDIWNKEQWENINKAYVTDLNYQSGQFDGIQYVMPTDAGIIIPNSADGVYAIDKDIFDKANVTPDDYMVDITEADSLLQKFYEANDCNPFICIENRESNRIIGDKTAYSPQPIAFFSNKMDLLSSGVGVTKENPPRIFNIFSDPYTIEVMKALARFQKAGYVTSNSNLSKSNFSMASTSKYALGYSSGLTITPSPTGSYIYYSPESLQQNIDGMSISSKTEHKEEAALLLYDLICDDNVKDIIVEYDINCVCICTVGKGDDPYWKLNYDYPPDENGDRITPYLNTLNEAVEIELYDYDLTGLEDIAENIDSYIIEISQHFFYEEGVLADENGELTDESIEKGMAEIAQHLEELGIQKIIDRLEEQIL